MYLGGNLEEYASETAAAAWLYDVPEEWIKAVIQTESNGNPKAYRFEPGLQDASYGLMQLLYSTAKGLGYDGAAAGLFDPHTNIIFGTMLLGQLRTKYGDDFARVYSAYNSGQPDRYLTSSQVAANVSRALSWLATFATNTVQTVYTVGAGAAETAAEFPAGLFLLGAAAVVLFRKKRR